MVGPRPRLRHYFVPGSPCPRCLEPLEERDGVVACAHCDYRMPMSNEPASARPEAQADDLPCRDASSLDDEPGTAISDEGERQAPAPTHSLPITRATNNSDVVKELLSVIQTQETTIATLSAAPPAPVADPPPGLMAVFVSLMRQVEDQHIRISELTRAVQSSPVAPEDFYRALRDGLDGMRSQLQSALEAQAERLESRLRVLEESIRQREKEVLDRERRLDEREARLEVREQRAEAAPALAEEIGHLRQLVEQQRTEIARLRTPPLPSSPPRRRWWPF